MLLPVNARKHASANALSSACPSTAMARVGLLITIFVFRAVGGFRQEHHLPNRAET